MGVRQGACLCPVLLDRLAPFRAQEPCYCCGSEAADLKSIRFLQNPWNSFVCFVKTLRTDLFIILWLLQKHCLKKRLQISHFRDPTCSGSIWMELNTGYFFFCWEKLDLGHRDSLQTRVWEELRVLGARNSGSVSKITRMTKPSFFFDQAVKIR